LAGIIVYNNKGSTNLTNHFVKISVFLWDDSENTLFILYKRITTQMYIYMAQGTVTDIIFPRYGCSKVYSEKIVPMSPSYAFSWDPGRFDKNTGIYSVQSCIYQAIGLVNKIVKHQFFKINIDFIYP
jgi:hypothetical protein